MAEIISLARRPETTPELSDIAERILRDAGAFGKLPTPIDDLIAASKLSEGGDPEPFLQGFLSRLEEKAREIYRSAIQKVRGIADLRERVIYIPGTAKEHRRLFVKSHELGHHVIPWHQVNSACIDDDHSLSHDAQEIFDQEANYFAAEVIFQGQRFTQRVRDYSPSFDSVFQIADEHGASRHATLWRYVEEQDEVIALIAYWPSQYTFDKDGRPTLRKGKIVGSPRFIEKYSQIQVPLYLNTGDPWIACRDIGEVCEGDINLTCDSVPVNFSWQTWWNTYSLFVLLRRKPTLSIVGRIIRD